MLTVSPERFLDEDDVLRLLRNDWGEAMSSEVSPRTLGIRIITMALEALGPTTGQRVADLTATSGYEA